MKEDIKLYYYQVLRNGGGFSSEVIKNLLEKNNSTLVESTFENNKLHITFENNGNQYKMNFFPPSEKSIDIELGTHTDIHMIKDIEL